MAAKSKGSDSFLLTPPKAREGAQMGLSADPERRVEEPGKAGAGRGRQKRKASAATSSAQAAPGKAKWVPADLASRQSKASTHAQE